MTKITTFYTSILAALSELQPGTDDFEHRLDELIGLLIRAKYAHHQRDVKADGSVDWSMCDAFIKQVEAGQHKNGIVGGWQNKEVQK